MNKYRGAKNHASNLVLIWGWHLFKLISGPRCLIGEGAYLSEYGLYSKNQNEEISLFNNEKNLHATNGIWKNYQRHLYFILIIFKKNIIGCITLHYFVCKAKGEIIFDMG